MKFYLFLRDDVEVDMYIEDAKETYTTLNEQGYCKVQEHYLYNNEEKMIELAKEKLDTCIEGSNEVIDIFSIDEMADMWILGTSKEDAAKQYLRELMIQA
ncbi:hypothetical protein [Clostridium sp.]